PPRRWRVCVARSPGDQPIARRGQPACGCAIPSSGDSIARNSGRVSRKSLLALFLESLDLLILPIVVAGGHGHEQPFHAAVLLTTEDPQTLVELLEILAGSQPVVERAQEEVLQASDGEA